MNQRAWMHAGMAIAGLFCAALALHPGFDNGFWRDDFVLLQRAHDAQEHPRQLLDRWVEPFNRPLAQMFFTLEYGLWGLDSGPYIVTNAVLHALNATLLFALFQGPLGAPAAAGAALLFALGLGFYGKAVFWAANVAELLCTTFVLATGIAALQAQRARGRGQRFAAMLISGAFLTLALLCKESGAVALPMVAGLMWPHRRSLSSLVRKLAVLVLVCGVYIALQLASDTGLGRILDQPRLWLALPNRALQLFAFMTLPLQSESTLVARLPALARNLIVLVDQVRPIYGLVLAGLAAFWCWRAPGAVRWLWVSFAAFLLPFGIIQMQGDWLDIRYAYLPATCYCGLVAYGLRKLWLRSRLGNRFLLALGCFGLLYANLAVTRSLELKYDDFGRSTESQKTLAELRDRLQGTE